MTQQQTATEAATTATAANSHPSVRPQAGSNPNVAQIESTEPGTLRVENLEAFYGSFRAVSPVSFTIPGRKVTAIIGPSGCGKSTFIRTLNRMHETTRGARIRGHVYLDGEDINAPKIDPVLIRRKIGMVFQKPNPFPTMSIYDNVAAGLKINGIKSKQHSMNDIVEQALRQAALWDEVKDKLKQSGTALSGGQQQRLCIARALAVKPEVLLMDEPCSALDPIATLAIEDLIRQLAPTVTIVIVTHNMQQASRVSDNTAFFMMNSERAGELVEYDSTETIFTNPADQRTEDYVTGRFG